MTHDNTSAVLLKFNSLFPKGFLFIFFKQTENEFKGAPKRIKNKKQPVFTLDHNIQDKSADNLKKYQTIESFAGEHGIDFFPAGRGIGHQVTKRLSFFHHNFVDSFRMNRLCAKKDTLGR